MTYNEIKKYIEENGIKKRAELCKENRKVYDNYKKLSKEEQDELLPSLIVHNYSDLNTISDFEKFIQENNIVSRKNFDRRFGKGYVRFLKILTKEEQDELLPSNYNDYSNLNTISDFEKFIQENNIVSRNEFQKRFYRGYRRFLKILTKEEQDELLPSNLNDYSNLNTVSDFRGFIQENNIVSRKNFDRRFGKGYVRFLKILTKEEQDELLPSNYNDYSNLNTISDFEKFIQENNIVSRGDFKKRFGKGYVRFLKILTKEEQDELLPSNLNDYSDLNTIEAFEKFIQENNIVSRDDFRRRFSKGYIRFLKILTKEEQDELLPSNYNDYSNLNTIGDFKKFIQENNIKSRGDFDRRFYGGYRRFLKILTKEEQDELLPSNYNDYSDLNTIGDFKKFIQENNIVSRDDFHRRFYGGYDRFLKSFTKEEQEELLPPVKSFGEISLRKLFDDNLINYVSEKTFEDLKGKKKHNLRYDFYLPDYNILIEYHGGQHFDPDSKLYTEEGIERDKIKFDYAKDNNIPIIYFTNEVEVYEEKGYFTEVITDSDILIQKIKEISLTN